MAITFSYIDTVKTALVAQSPFPSGFKIRNKTRKNFISRTGFYEAIICGLSGLPKKFSGPFSTSQEKAEHSVSSLQKKIGLDLVLTGEPS